MHTEVMLVNIEGWHTFVKKIPGSQTKPRLSRVPLSTPSASFRSAVSVSKSHDFGWRPTRRPRTQETGPHQVERLWQKVQMCRISQFNRKHSIKGNSWDLEIRAFCAMYLLQSVATWEPRILNTLSAPVVCTVQLCFIKYHGFFPIFGGVM